jgi:hypothetical protein
MEKGKLVILLKDPKASHTSIKNYRPITLLPEHGKIIEKIIRKAVEAELTPLHSRHQYGFTKGPRVQGIKNRKYTNHCER